MPFRPRVLLRVLLALTALTLVSLATASSGEAAEPWGELAHFAEKSGEIHEAEAAFGYYAEDKSLWVVDQEKEGSTFRLQKFQNVGGTWKSVASVVFKPSDKIHESEVEVEGVAFDPEEHRAYVLADEERSGAAGRIDPFDEAAGELWAFNTATPTSKIEFAAGTKEGVLATTETLDPNDKEHGKSLLEPGGITVNPKTHQILITGWVDRGKLGNTEEEETASVWALNDKGEIASKWVDESNFFEECGCVNSPIVTPSGKILTLSQEYEIDEIPASLESKTPAKAVVQIPNPVSCLETTCAWQEKLTQFPGEGGEEGAQMSLGPEGNIYVRNRIKLASEKNNRFGGVTVLNPSLEEIGWIGGGSSASESEVCSVNELTARPKIAAGEESVFMMQRAVGKAGKILELGPKGTNCPKGTATTPTAKAGGFELEAFPISDKVTLSSTLTQANAVSTEWEFEPGVVVKEPARQQETTLIEHKFAKAGTFTVKETIHTDNLATPVIEKTRIVKILPGPEIRKEEAIAEAGGATLKAEVNPNQQLTECEFEYGLVGGALTKKPCPTAPGEEETFVPESIKVTGLESGKEYEFRLVAKAGETTSAGEFVKFATLVAGGPKAETLAAGSVTSSGAVLKGMVNPEGKETNCKFEYGTTTAYGKEAPCASSPGKGTAAVEVSSAISGLAGSTAYHYRVVAENTSSQKAIGNDREFKTSEPGAAPTVEDLAASSVTQTGATLKATVNPHGETTECHFEYGTSTAYGKEAACPTAPGNGRAGIEEVLALTALTPGTTYHFRLVAKNALGKAEGADKEFATFAKAAPTAETKAASSVTLTGAMITAVVNPKGETTSCKFLYGTSTNYSKEASCSPTPGAVNEAVNVSASISGLTSGTVYHYKVIAEGPAGKAEGVDAEFKTVTPTPLPPPPPPPPGEGEVLHHVETKPVPTVTIAGTALSVAANGGFTIKLSCPAEETQCAGTVTLKTLTAVAATRGLVAKAKKAILTLASASFTIAGGKLKIVSLHLSSKAKKLLAKTHSIRARVTVVAHDPQGGAHTSTAIVTLKAAKKHH